MKKQLLAILLPAMAGTLWAADPVSTLITDEATFNLWTNIDGTGDGDGTFNAFYYDATEAAALMDGSERGKGPINDWMISPAVSLSAGLNYNVAALAKHFSTYSSDNQSFQIWVGTSTDTEAMDMIHNETLFRSSEYVAKGGTFSPKADGEYYFGFKATSSTWQGKLYFKGFEIYEIKSHPGAVWGFEVTGAEGGVLQATLSWNWPNKTDLDEDLTEAIPGAKIYRNTSSSFLTSELESLLVATVEGGEPGTEASYVDNSVPEGGEYYYMVVPFNAEGASTATAPKKSAWVGPDTFAANVTDARATATGDSSVEITFTAPTIGINGGWIDVTKLSYEITRVCDGQSTTLEESYSGPLPYVDNSIPALGSYSYNIYSKLDGKTSYNRATTNAVIAGGSIDLPYTESFTDDNAFSLMTRFYTGGTRDWGRKYDGYAFIWGNGADAWMVLPPMDFEAGQLYEVRFTNWNESNCGSRTMEVRLGTDATAEALTTVVYSEESVNTAREVKTAHFTVETAGRYFVAFRAYNLSDSKDAYLDEISIKASNNVPETVADLTVTAAADNSLNVTVAFTLPAKDVTGNDLATIERTLVTRGDDFIVYDQADQPAGNTIQILDEVPEAGQYSYTVVTYLNGNPSEAASATCKWVGPDLPTMVKNAKATLSEDSESVVITYDPMEIGVNGGVINPDNVRYRIQRMPDEVVVAEECSGTSFTDDVSTVTIGSYYYKIWAIYAGAQSEFAANTGEVTCGAPFEVPYVADFSSFDHMKLWTTPTVGEYNYWVGTYDNKWIYSSASECLRPDYSNEQCDENPWAFTPPVHAVAGEYKITMHPYCYLASSPERYTLVMSPAPDETHPDAVVLAENQDVTETEPEDVVHEFVIPAEGRYYFGFQTNHPEGYRLQVNKFNVELVKPYATGIDAAEIATDSEAEYYTLQGLRVADAANLAPGIYIRRAAGVATKVLVK